MTFALSHRSLAQFWRNARLIEGAVNAENELLAASMLPNRNQSDDGLDDLPEFYACRRSLPAQAASALSRQPRIAPNAGMELSHKRDKLQTFARAHNLSTPLDLMVFSKGQRWTDSPSFRCHLASALIDVPCLIDDGDGVFVGIPALSVSQMSSTLGTLELTRYLYELCGAYALEPSAPRGFVSCSPLVDPKSCLDFIDAAYGRRGKRKLRGVLGMVPPGYCASPRETALCMLLGLSREQGGYGLAPTGLNVRVDLGRQARAVYGKTSRVCDLMFGNLDVEYDSDLEHKGVLSSVGDSLRSTALAFEGIEVMHVYAENLRSLDRIDSLALSIARKLGRRIKLDQSEAGRKSRARLQQYVLRRHQPIV